MFGAPTGITALSENRVQPSVGIRNSVSGLSISPMSPDQAIAATTFSLVRSWM